jgi:hypothetical protein
MNKLAGLSLEGEFYDEFIPPLHEQDPSMPMYPNCLSHLLDTWDELQVGGEVSFQEWCDHFHNRCGGPPPSNDNDSSHVYKAAFLALWLCCFVVVGGGTRIRPGVLVTASWMAMGRKYALAQPALCSLYYSLRLICTNPVGPSYMKKSWSVHYIISWMGAYLKSIFGSKMRGPCIPFYSDQSRKPMMVEQCSEPQSISVLRQHSSFCAGTLMSFGVPIMLTHGSLFGPAKYFAYRFVEAYFLLGVLNYVSLSHIIQIV